MPSPFQNWNSGFKVSFVLIALGLLTFARVLGHEFLTWDDLAHICQNPHVFPPETASLQSIWQKSYFGLYIPVTYSVWRAFLQMLGGLGLLESCTDSAPYLHGLNLLLHILNSVLVYQILSTLLRKAQRSGVDNLWPAGLGALIFLLHPLQVESMAWISGMRDLLSMSFCLIALKIHLRDDSFKTILSAFLFWSLAILTKPSAVVLPAVLFAIDTLLLHRPWKKSFLRLSPWLLVAASAAVFTSNLQAASSHGPGLFSRFMAALYSIGFYAAKLVVPSGLSVDYARPLRKLAEAPELPWVALLVLLAGLALFWVLWRRKNMWALSGLLISLIYLSPVLGILPFHFQNFSQVADRFMYGSFFGIALIVAGIPALLSPRWQKAAFGLCLAAAWVSAHRLSDWKNDLTLFGAAVASHPGGEASHGKFGSALLQAGRLREAETQLRKALEINPGNQWATQYLGRLLLLEGRTPEAIDFYAGLIETGLATASNLFEFSQLLLPDPARRTYVIRLLEKASEMEPRYLEPRLVLSQLYFEDKNKEQGQKYLEEARQISADNPAVQALQQKWLPEK